MLPTIAADETITTRINFAKPLGVSAGFTAVSKFEKVSQHLCEKTLRRPLRSRPIDESLSNAELRKLAVKYPPPPEWFEGEQDCPF